MYAIFRSGGKQHRVAVGDLIDVEKLDVPVGERITIDDVLMVYGDGEVRVGNPKVEGAAIIAEVVAHGKDRKVIVYKFKKRKNYRRKRGHRQYYTRLRIEEIKV
ncbi:50S ribosomal protein L21 [Candidatus Poribacteria bacterium]|nr:50S ribosomal protein L21 [Candidatus Poribacteria bacterium]